jgi:dipeptidyl aminopeptidase/acylaminoacyl peptidase
MRLRCAALVASVGLASLSGCASRAARPLGQPPLVPRRAFFADPDRQQVQLSPDGKWIGYLAPGRDPKRTMNVWVMPVRGPSTTAARQVTEQRDSPVLEYRWTYLRGKLVLAVPAQEGVHVVVVDLASGASRDLTPGKGVVAAIEKLSTEHVGEVLLRVKEPGPGTFDYHRVDLRTGARRIVFEDKPKFDRVLFDDDWRPRVAVRTRPNAGYQLLKRDGSGAWAPFASFAYGIEEDSSHPILVDRSGATLYLVDNRGRDTAALKAIELASGKETVLAADPLADVLPALWVQPTTGRVQSAVSYYGRQRRHFLDPSIIPDYEFLRTVHRGDIGFVAPYGGRSLDDKTWLVLFMDGGPMRYYVYDRRARRARFLFSETTALDRHPLGRRHLEVLTTRDGIALPADLYLPAREDPHGSGRPRRPLPTLIYVHGGSWGIYPWNSWLTNRTLMLLADRGYAVLRVEFRGAGGFGRRLHEAGLREWGGKMQDDLLDAARWAVDQGIAARRRIGIWGWSYGGYAALAALATADRFACGLSMYGPTELDSFIAEGSREAQFAWRHYIGDNTTEEGRALLRKRSPLHHVERFARPVLVVQGGKDQIVPQAQADRFVEAMQKHGKPVVYLLYPDEPHDLRRAESWTSAFAVAERFFHEHLGGRYEPIGDDLRGSLEVRAGRELIPGLSDAMARAQAPPPPG